MITDLLRRSFHAKELCAHVVVDPNNVRTLFRESLDGFRTNQSCGSSDDDCAHLFDDNRSDAMGEKVNIPGGIISNVTHIQGSQTICSHQSQSHT